MVKYIKMNFYRAQTSTMIEHFKASKSLNVISDFYAQLSNIRPIASLNLINALNASEMDSSKLVTASITFREWMKHITLEDIRNHVVFSIWKEQKQVVDHNNYYDTTVPNDSYHRCHRPAADPSMHIEEIGKLLETSFYIRQICVLKELLEDDFDDLSIVEDEEWDMYHNWLFTATAKKGLVYTVYENFKLLEGLIMSHQ